MNISLPDTLKAFVDEQVAGRGYGTSSEYVRELIRKDQECLQLRSLLLAGASSAPTSEATRRWGPGLRPTARRTASYSRSAKAERPTLARFISSSRTPASWLDRSPGINTESPT